MPDLTTSRSISSTGSRVRAPPISRPISADALALEPEHLSCYELEAKPGTRFTHAWGDELGRQADAMEDYFERVVATLTGAGYRWYETANFCRTRRRTRPSLAAQPRLLARPRLPRHRDRRGLDNRRPALAQHAEARALPGGARRRAHAPERELEPLDDDVRARERVMLGLRLDEPLPLAGLRARARPRRSRAGREARSRRGVGRHARRSPSAAASSAAASRSSCSPERGSLRAVPAAKIPCK